MSARKLMEQLKASKGIKKDTEKSKDDSRIRAKQCLVDTLCDKYEEKFNKQVETMRVKKPCSQTLPVGEFKEFEFEGKKYSFKEYNILHLVLEKMCSKEDSLMSLINWRHYEDFKVMFWLKDREQISSEIGRNFFERLEEYNKESKEAYEAGKALHVKNLVEKYEPRILETLSSRTEKCDPTKNVWFIWYFKKDELSGKGKYSHINILYLILNELCGYGKDLSILFYRILKESEKDIKNNSISVNFTMKTEEQLEFEERKHSEGAASEAEPSEGAASEEIASNGEDKVADSEEEEDA